MPVSRGNHGTGTTFPQNAHILCPPSLTDDRFDTFPPTYARTDSRPMVIDLQTGKYKRVNREWHGDLRTTGHQHPSRKQ